MKLAAALNRGVKDAYPAEEVQLPPSRAGLRPPPLRVPGRNGLFRNGYVRILEDGTVEFYLMPETEGRVWVPHLVIPGHPESANTLRDISIFVQEFRQEMKE